ncbi:hypothetical protein MT350_19485 [Rathayibacter sp. VKM Ac-2928]|nr:hypothetical protein [Rathayibacter sp. VKM Ac-2928]
MDDAMEHVKRAAGADEVWEERRFQIYRGSRQITVTVSDQGPSVPPTLRYSARAEGTRPEDTTVSHGNPASTIEDALENVHWQEFDGEA